MIDFLAPFAAAGFRPFVIENDYFPEFYFRPPRSASPIPFGDHEPT